MIWDDYGFLISKNKYNENSLISEIFTKNHGKITGLIFGGTSKKMKNYLQIGNKVYVNYNSKSINKMGYFKVEIFEAITPRYFDNYKKLNCITCAMNLIRSLTAEAQSNKKIYNSINEFFNFLNSKSWIKEYIFWELKLFKNLGYDLELEKLVDKKTMDNKTSYISKSKFEKKIIPNFLIDKNNEFVDTKTLLNGLNLLGDYLDKSILKPNNLSQPLSRIQFINSLK